MHPILFNLEHRGRMTILIPTAMQTVNVCPQAHHDGCTPATPVFRHEAHRMLRCAGVSAAASAAEAQQILYRRGQRRPAEFEERPPSQGESRRWERSGRFSKRVPSAAFVNVVCPNTHWPSCCNKFARVCSISKFATTPLKPPWDLHGPCFRLQVRPVMPAAAVPTLLRFVTSKNKWHLSTSKNKWQWAQHLK